MAGETIGKVPKDVVMALGILKYSPDPDNEEGAKGIVDGWIGENELRKNYIQAELEDRGESGGRSTGIITPTSGGTGLSRQEKTPRL